MNLNLDIRKVLLEVFSRKRGKVPHNKHFLLLHFAWTFHILFPHTFLFLFRQLIVFVDILKVTVKLSVLFLLFPGLCCACCCHRGKDHTCTQCCQLSRIIQETPDFGPYLPVSRLEYEISQIFTEVCHSVVDSTFQP